MQDRNRIKSEMDAARRGGEMAQELVDMMSDGNIGSLPSRIYENTHYKTLIEKLAKEDNYKSNGGSKKADVDKLVAVLGQKSIQKRGRLKIIYSAVSVAVALMVVSFAVWYGSDRRVVIMAENGYTKSTEIVVDRPTLILSDGKNVDLSQGDMSIVDEESELKNESNNTLSYSNISASAVIKYNTIIVPCKYTYNIVLADGTSVTLNAGSQLKYPVNFNASTRDVYLQGEGFFDVSKDTKPFIVHSAGVAVKVFGTKFNVNNSSASSVVTYLVEGSVGININGSSYSMLKPNQLSVADSKSVTNVVESVIDSDKYILWMQNYFAFKSDSVKDVADVLSRWYGVRIDVFGHTDALITARYSRDTELNEVLSSLGAIAGVKFKVVANDVK